MRLLCARGEDILKNNNDLMEIYFTHSILFSFPNYKMQNDFKKLLSIEFAAYNEDSTISQNHLIF